jgi:DNA-binding HxlR family transcriptional regulator
LEKQTRCVASRAGATVIGRRYIRGVDLKDKPTKRICSVADALAIVGDRYSLLIVREIGYGYVRFEDLAGFTGAPRDVLTSRLRRLEDVGVLERRIYSEHPPRYEYHLTESGFQLRPIVLALKEWGDQQLNPGAAPVVFEHTCGAEFHPRTVCAACGEPVGTGELVVKGGTHPVKGDPW